MPLCQELTLILTQWSLQRVMFPVWTGHIYICFFYVLVCVAVAVTNLRSKLLRVRKCERTSQRFMFQVIRRHLWRKCVASVRRGIVHSYVHTYLLNRYFPHESAVKSCLLRKILRKITAESCGKSKHIRVDIHVRLHRKIEEFVEKGKLSVSNTVGT